MKIKPEGMVDPRLWSLIHELRLGWALRILLPGIRKSYEMREDGTGYKQVYNKDEGADDFYKIVVILFPSGVF